MSTLTVSAAGYIFGPVPATEEGPIFIDLYVSVTRATDGTPVTGLSWRNFSVKLFMSDGGSPPKPVDVTITVPVVDENGEPVLDENGSPQMDGHVRITTEPGVYIIGGALRGFSGKAFFVRVQTGSDQGEAVGAAVRHIILAHTHE